VTTNSATRAVREAVEAKDPQRVLDAARLAASVGEHGAALRGYVWFHRSALRFGRRWYGDRLAFALAEWVDLGAVYNPAMERYEAILEAGVNRLLRGRGNFDLFHDVASMNEWVNRESDSLDLFAKLEGSSPRRAADFFPLVRDLLTARAEYAICDRYTAPCSNWHGIPSSLRSSCLSAPRCSAATTHVATSPRSLMSCSRFCGARAGSTKLGMQPRRRVPTSMMKMEPQR
jgi:hypothetical protein